jgi:hypothetical protein
MSKKLTKKQRVNFVSYLNEQMREYEWQATFQTDPDKKAYCRFQATKFRLQIYRRTESPQRYKELYKEWMKEWLLPEEYAKIDAYLEKKYGVPATKEAIAL